MIGLNGGSGPRQVLWPDAGRELCHVREAAELRVGQPPAAGEVVEFIGVSMDETERVRANVAVQEAQAELARVARLTTMGELTASIAHEINQPLAAVVANGNAALRWLNRPKPDIAEAAPAQASQRARPAVDASLPTLTPSWRGACGRASSPAR